MLTAMTEPAWRRERDGELRIVNWLRDPPETTPAKSATTVAAVTTARTTEAEMQSKPNSTKPVPRLKTSR